VEKYINKINLGDSLELLPSLPENSVDAIITDPPYELGFMERSIEGIETRGASFVFWGR